MLWWSSRLPISPQLPTPALPPQSQYLLLSDFAPAFTLSTIHSLTCQFFSFCFHFLNKKLKWHLSHPFSKTWLRYPISTVLLLDCWLHFGRINTLEPPRSVILQGPLTHLPFWYSPWNTWWTWRNQRLTAFCKLPLSVFRTFPATVLMFFWEVKHGLNPLWQVGNLCLYVTDSWINNIT